MAAIPIRTVKVDSHLSLLFISAKICQADLHLFPSVKSIVVYFLDLRFVDRHIVWLSVNNEEAEVLLDLGERVTQEVGLWHEVGHRSILIRALLLCNDRDTAIENSRVVTDQVTFQALVRLRHQRLHKELKGADQLVLA